MRDPDRLRNPQSCYVRRFTQDGQAVGREGKHAVESVGQLKAAQGGKKLVSGSSCNGEVLGSKLHHRGGAAGLGGAEYVIGLHRQWFVPIVSYAVALALLAKVHGEVLMPHDRMDNLAGLAPQRGYRLGARVLVLHG